MDIFILEPITQQLAAGIVKDVTENPDKPLTVHIMSMGGDMLAGNAIINALESTPAHVTTKVIGVSASMASVISQAGDTRLIAPDATFNIHYGSASTPGRGTADDHLDAAETVTKLDDLMIKSFDKTGLSAEQLDLIMKSDALLTADEAVQLGFFDGYAEPIKAVAELNKQNKEMSKIKELMAAADLAAIKLGIKSTEDEGKQALVNELGDRLKAQAEEQVIEKKEVAESGAEILTSEMVPREEFESFKAEIMALVSPLLGAVEELPTPEETTTIVEEKTEAKLNNLLQAIKSKTQAPSARQSFEQPEVQEKEDWSVYEAKKKEIAEKNKR